MSNPAISKLYEENQELKARLAASESALSSERKKTAGLEALVGEKDEYLREIISPKVFGVLTIRTIAQKALALTPAPLPCPESQEASDEDANNWQEPPESRPEEKI